MKTLYYYTCIRKLQNQPNYYHFYLLSKKRKSFLYAGKHYYCNPRNEGKRLNDCGKLKKAKLLCGRKLLKELCVYADFRDFHYTQLQNG